MLAEDNDNVEILWLGITPLEAQDQLKQFKAMDWPNLSKGKRRDTHKELFKQAYPSEIRKKNYISVDDLQKVLGR